MKKDDVKVGSAVEVAAWRMPKMPRVALTRRAAAKPMPEDVGSVKIWRSGVVTYVDRGYSVAVEFDDDGSALVLEWRAEWRLT